ncbi:serine/threonine protein phosphatase 2A 55 kDa regulatory subunit B beta isoform-like isoform X1 [Gastrolobium bilobum]|uniref:serine/threonine protein phosphatase 2A 55 kDa regulatory subunit B beta isoform-like isoform X1 n=1 Tax=Gastrolobium bilobum TaxID=150636 RepID=UPI002AB05DA3|nr:serine/threonine protein phosphatase 2A 55 kDa regulatory subunit B beta isoform-like isoform X1 [Gastrolobium bilobum]XP_061339301.1 serine/threonine protein phosphatase 2A 55 kDa regulatory subunit B beta isoform-like isoform X1 [Gastrolobium bilobum]
MVRVIEKIWSSWISLLRGIPSFFTRRNFRVTSPSLIISKIVEIEKRINKVRWGITHNGLLFLLSTNDKTIKLWKVKEHKVKQVKEMAPILCSENMLLAERSYICGQETHSAANGYHLEWTEKMPGNLLQPQDIDTKISGSEDTVHTKCRKVYSYAHGFNINSISNNSDIETFISADDLRINLWNLEVSDECFNIIDMKPSNMEDLTEIITSAEFHPLHCNLLAYSSSRLTRFYSSIRFAVCDHASRILIIQISALKVLWIKVIFYRNHCIHLRLKFSNDGQHPISRDYMNMKVLLLLQLCKFSFQNYIPESILYYSFFL